MFSPKTIAKKISDGIICYEKNIPKYEKLKSSLKLDEIILKMKTIQLFIHLDDDHFRLSVNGYPLEENIIGIPIFQDCNIGYDIPNNSFIPKILNVTS